MRVSLINLLLYAHSPWLSFCVPDPNNKDFQPSAKLVEYCETLICEIKGSPGHCSGFLMQIVATTCVVTAISFCRIQPCLETSALKVLDCNSTYAISCAWQAASLVQQNFSGCAPLLCVCVRTVPAQAVPQCAVQAR